MIEVLRFTFESFWHFVGVSFLIFWIGAMCVGVASQIGKIGRPRKHVRYSYKDTHQL